MPLKKTANPSTKNALKAPPALPEKEKRQQAVKAKLEPETKQIKERCAFNLPVELHTKMRKHYAETGTPMSTLVERAVEDYLKKC